MFLARVKWIIRKILLKTDLMKYFAFAIGVVVCLRIVGCCTCRDMQQEKMNLTSPFKIELGAGGGFSGFYSGYILSSDGTISRTSYFPNQQEKIEIIGASRRNEIFEIKELIDSLGVTKLTIQKTGNMTSKLIIEEGDKRYLLSWSGTLYEQDVTPNDVQPVVDKILNLIEKIEKKSTDQK